jgi:hypothetical protein
VCDCWAAFGTDTEIGLRRPRQRVGSTAQTEPETGIIPDEELTKAAGSENSALAVAEKFLATEDETHASGTEIPLTAQEICGARSATPMQTRL